MIIDVTYGTIINFIVQFRTHAYDRSDQDPYFNDVIDVVECLFRRGYCWHFAHLLKTTFGCGEVCWAAPFGHFVWMYNDTCWDIEGEYDGEALYFIPERYIPEENLLNFKHIPNSKGVETTKEEILHMIERYCEETKVEYRPDDILQFLKNDPFVPSENDGKKKWDGC